MFSTWVLPSAQVVCDTHMFLKDETIGLKSWLKSEVQTSVHLEERETLWYPYVIQTLMTRLFAEMLFYTFSDPVLQSKFHLRIVITFWECMESSSWNPFVSLVSVKPGRTSCRCIKQTKVSQNSMKIKTMIWILTFTFYLSKYVSLSKSLHVLVYTLKIT